MLDLMRMNPRLEYNPSWNQSSPLENSLKKYHKVCCSAILHITMTMRILLHNKLQVQWGNLRYLLLHQRTFYMKMNLLHQMMVHLLATLLRRKIHHCGKLLESDLNPPGSQLVNVHLPNIQVLNMNGLHREARVRPKLSEQLKLKLTRMLMRQLLPCQIRILRMMFKRHFFWLLFMMS